MQAIMEGMGDFVNDLTTDTDKEFYDALVNNVWQFAGAKNYQQMKDIAAAMVDANGVLRTYKDFRFESAKINADYVDAWLKAEYNNAVAGAQMGAKWKRIWADKDELPYIRYRTAGDDHVRLQHQLWEGITRKVIDPIWQWLFPPNGWGCRCDVDQLSYVKKETDASAIALDEIPPLFRFNPGISNMVFPAGHPYFDGLPAKLKKQVNEIKRFADAEFTPAQSLKEAEQFAVQKLGTKYVNYKNIDLGIANDINRAVLKTKTLMPEMQINGLGNAQLANKEVRKKLIDEYKNTDWYKHIKDKFGIDQADRLAIKFANSYVSKVQPGVIAWSWDVKKATNIAAGIDIDISKYAGIYINEKKAAAKETMDALVLKNQIAKWFANGAPDFSYIMSHEIGHEIEKFLQLKKENEFLDVYRKWSSEGISKLSENLSSYGATAGNRPQNRLDEFIAEAWAEFTTAQKPRPLAKEVGEVILKVYYSKHISGTGTTYTKWISEILKLIGQ